MAKTTTEAEELVYFLQNNQYEAVSSRLWSKDALLAL